MYALNLKEAIDKSKMFKSAGRQTTARPGPARPAGRVVPGLAARRGPHNA